MSDSTLPTNFGIFTRSNHPHPPTLPNNSIIQNILKNYSLEVQRLQDLLCIKAVKDLQIISVLGKFVVTVNVNLRNSFGKEGNWLVTSYHYLLKVAH